MSDYKIQIDKSVIHLENDSFISLCREDYDLFTIATEDCFAEVNKEQLQALYELIKFMQFNRKSGWISIDDELPQKAGKYLVVKNNALAIEYVEPSGYYDHASYIKENMGISHWQEIPLPPLESEDD